MTTISRMGRDYPARQRYREAHASASRALPAHKIGESGGNYAVHDKWGACYCVSCNGKTILKRWHSNYQPQPKAS